MAFVVACSGSLTLLPDGAASCSTDWVAVPLEVVAGSRLDVEDYNILFGAVLFFLLIGFSVKMIRRVLSENASRN